MPVIKWRDGAFELTSDENPTIGMNILQLVEVTESKNYTCVASSDLGNIEHVAEVKVKGKWIMFTCFLGNKHHESQTRLTYKYKCFISVRLFKC